MKTIKIDFDLYSYQFCDLSDKVRLELIERIINCAPDAQGFLLKIKGKINKMSPD